MSHLLNNLSYWKENFYHYSTGIMWKIIFLQMSKFQNSNLTNSDFLLQKLNTADFSPFKAAAFSTFEDFILSPWHTLPVCHFLNHISKPISLTIRSACPLQQNDVTPRKELCRRVFLEEMLLLTLKQAQFRFHANFRSLFQIRMGTVLWFPYNMRSLGSICYFVS